MRSPSSFVHEVGHMIDYQKGNLSEQYTFKSVRSRYEELLEDVVDKNTALKAVWYGRTKYNRDYYLEPTEIFARCFEMYMLHIKGVINSLLKPELDWCYPEDKDFLELIKNYFDCLFGKEETVVKKEDYQEQAS